MYCWNGDFLKEYRGGITTHNWTSGPVPSPIDTFGTVDQMTYSYDGNQVKSISDNASGAIYLGAQDFKNNASTTDEYSYDANGNQTKDLNKDLVTIRYNQLNLPDVVQVRNGNMINYRYDALGRKEEVRHTTMVTSGISLPIGKTLNDTTLQNVYKHTEIERYSSNVKYYYNSLYDIQLSCGYLKRTNYDGNFGTRPVYAYCYYVYDHLGNIRAVIDGAGVMQQVNNYTPFGVEYGKSAENSNVSAINTYRNSMSTYQDFQFGGKELDRKFELNFYDFGARTYDAAKGRWTTMDPLAEKYYSWSPYVYCKDNPVKIIDPDGKQTVLFGLMDPIILASRSTPIVENLPKTTEVLKSLSKATEEVVKSNEYHVIPRGFKNNEVVKAAREDGFKFEGKENKISVEKYSKVSETGRHANHPKYNSEIKNSLNDFKQSMPDFTNHEAGQFLKNYTKDVKNIIKNNPDVKINDLFKVR